MILLSLQKVNYIGSRRLLNESFKSVRVVERKRFFSSFGDFLLTIPVLAVGTVAVAFTAGVSLGIYLMSNMPPRDKNISPTGETLEHINRDKDLMLNDMQNEVARVYSKLDVKDSIISSLKEKISSLTESHDHTSRAYDNLLNFIRDKFIEVQSGQIPQRDGWISIIQHVRGLLQTRVGEQDAAYSVLEIFVFDTNPCNLFLLTVTMLCLGLLIRNLLRIIFLKKTTYPKFKLPKNDFLLTRRSSSYSPLILSRNQSTFTIVSSPLSIYTLSCRSGHPRRILDKYDQ